MGGENLTIQLGHKANYLATHFWNSQEATFQYGESEDTPLIDNDVNFRIGLGPQGVETYTPRALIYDLKGGFGSLKKYNELYHSREREADPAWDGKVQTYVEPKVSESAYQTALNTGTSEDVLTADKVRYWSDFNRVYYHPRSAIQLNQYQLNTSPFDSYNQGRDLFLEIDKGADILDRDVRPFAEECDSLQGFQVIMEGDSAWAGFGAEYLEVLRNEYPKTTIWTWGIESENTKPTRKLTYAQMIPSMYETTSVYIPLVQPPRLARSVSIDPTSYWHTSALLSILYDSITLPTRTRKEHLFAMDMYELTARVNIHGQRKIVNPEITVLFDHPTIRDLMSMGWPEVIGERPILASVLRGSFEEPDAVSQMFGRTGIFSERIIHPQLFPLPTSFPKIFPTHANMKSLSTLATLSSNPTTISSRLKQIGGDARRLSNTEQREDLVNSVLEISNYFEEDEDLDMD